MKLQLLNPDAKEAAPALPPDPETFEWFDTLRTLLAPYEPVAARCNADTFFSTAEIKNTLEEHEGGDVTTQELVLALRHLGYSDANTGGLRLEWVAKKRGTVSYTSYDKD